MIFNDNDICTDIYELQPIILNLLPDSNP